MDNKINDEKISEYLKEKFNDLFMCNADLTSLLESIIGDKHSFDDLRQQFTAIMFGRAYKMYKAIQLLCKHGYGEVAFSQTRSLFEIALTMKYILKDSSNNLCERYINYDNVYRMDIWEKVFGKDEIQKIIRGEKIVEEKLGDTIIKVAPLAEEGRKKYKYKFFFGWSDKSKGKMADDVGMREKYDTIYSLQCDMSHSGIRSIALSVQQKDEKSFSISIDKGEDFIMESLVQAFDSFQIIIENCIKEFNWQLKDELELIKNKMEKLLPKLLKK